MENQKPGADKGKLRECGTCSLCCTTLAVFELQKPVGTPCSLLLRKAGCSIYKTRPPSCENFKCLWLEGHFEEEDMPRRLGVVLFEDVSAIPTERLVCCSESYPGAAEESLRVQELIQELLSPNTSVIIRNEEYLKKLYYNGKVERREIDQTDPMLINISSKPANKRRNAST